ncbi:MAG: alpha/beta hydrolase, partial [Saprospiraceae bacterium]
MMKFKFSTLLFLLASLWNQEFCQQWIDRTYNYDSTYNVVYGSSINFNGVLESHKMDIFTPLCDDDQHISTRPLLLWIHGGAFLAGDKNDPSIINMCKQFARRGYVTASIDYRLGFIADDQPWDCTYPNYKCVFAADTSEWYRALFRSIQDGKGALRYLMNRNQQFRIDTNNVFVAGESAGAFVALGIGLLDTVIEKFAQAYALTEVARPNSNTFSCVYNAGLTFNNAFISRPDLGNIEGNIEPSNIRFKIKGIGNFYGGLASDFLKYSKSGLMKPAIYSFHQPCDLVVPIDSGRIFSGLSWCMTNGYNCFAIANTAKVYGSR